MNLLPEVKELNGIQTLFVDGKPFVALSGEIHNSSSSSPDYMLEKVWPNVAGLNINSLIVPVMWEQIEAEEGQFDFSVIDAIIGQARERKIRLTLLWFGLWKNSESMYVPGWMKRNTETYFLAQRVDGTRYHTISPFCEAAVEKDANAFAHLMAHIRETDPDHTVIVMQVENEIGLHGGAPGTERDYSEIGNAYYSSEVPAVLQEKLGVSGTWEEAFGEDAAESLMAWAFAAAVEKIASAGKKELDLPCYVNAWLEQPPYRAGMGHPSGGPIARMHPIWRATAPSLFCFGPDIYVPYAAEVMEAYTRDGNPLFIPEIRKDAATATLALYAVAGHNALCYAPFGIEDVNMRMEDIEGVPLAVLRALEIDVSAMDITGTAAALSESYRILSDMWPLILEKRGTKQLQAFICRHDDRMQHICKFGKYDIQVNYSRKEEHVPDSGGFIVELSDDEFLLVGTRYGVRFLPKIGENCTIGIEMFQEGSWKEGSWKPGRILNGDERMMPRVTEKPMVRYLKLFKY